jgi:hypothetical protein
VEGIYECILRGEAARGDVYRSHGTFPLASANNLNHPLDDRGASKNKMHWLDLLRHWSVRSGAIGTNSRNGTNGRKDLDWRQVGAKWTGCGA